MGFQSVKSWTDTKKIIDKGITILLPGGYKPTTGAHLSLIEKYANDPAVGLVRVLIGPGIRSGIDQSKATKIMERLAKDIKKVSIEPVQWPSPVLTAYKIIGEAEPGYYALGASSKGDDYKRVNDFVSKHADGAKYSRAEEGVHVIELSIDSDPLLFHGRTDDLNETPISASILRNDIINDDFDNFVTGYPNSMPYDIQFVWEELAETVMNESMYTSGQSTISSSYSLDRSRPGSYYKSTFPILEDDDIENISEGGGGGHLMSPWESIDMTFGEIKNLISDALDGKLENVTEKLDGQNLMITVKNDQVYIARTQKQMKNGGELAMPWNEISELLGDRTPDFIKKAFQQAANDLQTAISYAKTTEINKIFDNGQNWLNIELLNPETENIVPYGEFQLRIHNMRSVDANGKESNIIWSGGGLDKIISYIETAQELGKLKKTHLISKTNSVNFASIKDLNNIKNLIIEKLQLVMDKTHLDDDNNIGDYITAEIKDIIKDKINQPELVYDLIQRWVYENKSKNIGQVLKDQDISISKFVKEMDKSIDDEIGLILDPIIEIFSRLGIAILQNLTGIAASNPSIVTDGIRKKAIDASSKIKNFINNPDTKNITDFDKKINYLETQLRRIEQAGGLDGIAPIEGIVFEYNGKLFKLTGVYLPILKMINFFQFGKNK